MGLFIILQNLTPWNIVSSAGAYVNALKERTVCKGEKLEPPKDHNFPYC